MIFPSVVCYTIPPKSVIFVIIVCQWFIIPLKLHESSLLIPLGRGHGIYNGIVDDAIIFTT